MLYFFMCATFILYLWEKKYVCNIYFFVCALFFYVWMQYLLIFMCEIIIFHVWTFSFLSNSAAILDLTWLDPDFIFQLLRFVPVAVYWKENSFLLIMANNYPFNTCNHRGGTHHCSQYFVKLKVGLHRIWSRNICDAFPCYCRYWMDHFLQ